MVKSSLPLNVGPEVLRAFGNWLERVTVLSIGAQESYPGLLGGEPTPYLPAMVTTQLCSALVS